MGIVTRQSTWNLALIIVGFMIGGVSKFFVMPELLSKDELGKLELIIYHAVMLSTLLNLGTANSVVKYYNDFALKDRQHLLLRNMLLLPVFASLIAGFFLLAFPDAYANLVEDASKNFIVGAIGVLVMLTFSQNLTLTLSGISSTQLKSTFPLFLSEILLRLFLVSGVVLYYLEYLSFPGLVIAYGSSYLLVVFALALNLRKPLLSSLFRRGPLEGKERKEIAQFGLFSLLDSGANKLVSMLDILMIGYFLQPAYVGFYTISIAVSAVVKMSSRAITPIANPLIAKSWSEGDISNIKDIYSKSSLNQMVIGGMMMIAVWASIDSLEQMLPAEYRYIKYPVFWLLIGNLVNVSAGINGSIILNSEKYRMNFYLNSVLLVITFLLNALLIPEFGIEGAAIATCASLTIFNGIKFLYIFKQWGIQPFSLNHFWSAILIAGFVVIGNNLPGLVDNIYIDVIIKSTVMAVVYGAIVYLLKISPDINANLKRISPIKLP